MASEYTATVRKTDLLGVFWRSFFLQASWSYERMQSLGFAFAMAPVMRRLYRDEAERSARTVVHMEYFNTQPYMASFILGATARLEEDRAQGAKQDADVAELKKTLMAPLGALGDSYFWGSLKPFAAAAAVALLLAGVGWAPLVFLGLYNLCHVGMRLMLVFAGYETRGDVVALMSRFNLTIMARLFKAVSLSLVGCALGTAYFWRPEFRAGLHPAVIAVAGPVIALGLNVLLRKGLSPLNLMFGLAAACLGLAYGGII